MIYYTEDEIKEKCSKLINLKWREERLSMANFFREYNEFVDVYYDLRFNSNDKIKSINLDLNKFIKDLSKSLDIYIYMKKNSDEFNSAHVALENTNFKTALDILNDSYRDIKSLLDEESINLLKICNLTLKLAKF